MGYMTTRTTIMLCLASFCVGIMACLAFSNILDSTEKVAITGVPVKRITVSLSYPRTVIIPDEVPIGVPQDMAMEKQSDLEEDTAECFFSSAAMYVDGHVAGWSGLLQHSVDSTVPQAVANARATGFMRGAQGGAGCGQEWYELGFADGSKQCVAALESLMEQNDKEQVKSLAKKTLDGMQNWIPANRVTK